jgi:hypothetical protein
MAERIDLEVPATANALSTVRMVLGGLGVRLTSRARARTR